jgi:hypothetical protein
LKDEFEVGCAVEQNLALIHERDVQGDNRRVALQTSQLLPSDFPADFMMELHCECTQPECDQLINISYAKYGLEMKEGDLFVIRPEHFAGALEVVVDRAGDYWVVAKRTLR